MIRITQNGKTQNYIKYCESLVENKTASFTLTASGRSSTKAIIVANVIISKYPCYSQECSLSTVDQSSVINIVLTSNSL